MSFMIDDAKMQRLWPIRFNGTRHTDKCYYTLVDQAKHPEIYLKPICQCGLDIWLQMTQLPTLTQKRAREFGWM